MADLIERYKITANLPSVLMNYSNRFNSKQIELITEMIYELENSIESADVQPVRRGRWSECYTDSRLYSGICTVCGKASIRSIKENPLEYCPKCGARMDGDTNG